MINNSFWEKLNNMTKDEKIDVLTNMCYSLNSECKESRNLIEKYSEALDKVIEENSFLTETIKKDKRCRITQERRELIDENSRLRKAVALLISQLRCEYYSR